MGSGAMIYIIHDIKTESGIQKEMGGGGITDAQTTQRLHKPISIFSK
jgi:hypothetical protein